MLALFAGLLSNPTSNSQSQNPFWSSSQSTTGQTTTTQTQGLFGNPTTTPLMQGLFGKPAASTPAQGLFRKPAAQSTGGFFDGGNVGTTATASTTFGGQTAMAPGTSVFGGNSSAGVFGNQSGSGMLTTTTGGSNNQPGAAVIGSNSGSTNIFGNSGAQQTQPSVFGNTQQSGGFSPQTFNTQPQSGGLLGNKPQQQPQQQQQQQQQQHKSTLYTPIDQLTAEERQQFEAPKFTLGKIPMKPPPREFISN